MIHMYFYWSCDKLHWWRYCIHVHVHSNTANYSVTMMWLYRTQYNKIQSQWCDYMQSTCKPCIASETGWLQLLILSAASTLASLELWLCSTINIVILMLVKVVLPTDPFLCQQVHGWTIVRRKSPGQTSKCTAVNITNWQKDNCYANREPRSKPTCSTTGG